MSDKRNRALNAPDHLDVGTGADRRSIARAADLYAVHAIRPGARLEHAILTLDEGEIAVFRGSGGARELPPGAVVGPVYELHPGGSLGVPTGLVFIRFIDAETLESRRDDLTRAGFDVERVLSYAPGAAWLKPRTGRIEDGLRGIDVLKRLPGVENVEAEMKSTRQARD
jgi:hypothetical protein